MREEISLHYPESLILTGFDDAIIGIYYNSNDLPVVAYLTDTIIDILMNRDGMDIQEATEYFDFNIYQAYVGEYTPIFVFGREMV